MRVILSRKGFDSGAGGCPSPILPDGTLLSLPIPDSTGNYIYEDLMLSTGVTYSEILKSLNPNAVYTKCHLDPDIRKDIRKTPTEWVPAFGQVDAAQTHLMDNNIKKGDLFLFFGWFRETEYYEGKLRFVKKAPDVHVIYAYLQIGEVLDGIDVKKCPWHPHADDSHIYDKRGEIKNNTIYVASNSLQIDGIDSNLPGAGTLTFSEKLVLTAENRSRTRWKLNDVFENVNLTYHNKDCIKNGYFQSRARGQEFIFDENPKVIEWAISKIM